MQQYDQFYKETQSMVAAGRADEAIFQYRNYLKTAPHTPVMLHNFAALLGDKGLFNEAVQVCEQAFSMGLDAPETLLIYARALQGVGRSDDAQANYHKVLSKRPLDYAAQRELAQLIWMLSNDADKAVAPIEKYLKTYPSDAGLKVVHAQILGYVRDATEELEALRKVIRLEGAPDVGWDFYLSAALKAGAFEHVLEVATRGFSSNPNYHKMREYISRASLALGEPDPAISHIEKLRSLFEGHQYYTALLATAYRLKGDERYKEYFDYDALIGAFPLDVPSGWRSLDSYINDLIQVLDEMHQYKAHPFGLSVRNGSQLSSIENMDHPALKAFAVATAGPIKRYLASVEASYGDDSSLGAIAGESARLDRAWSVSLPSTGFHVNHVHPQGWLSSACHLRIAEKPSPDSKAGWLKFGEPGIATVPTLEDEFFQKPEVGTIVFFPSYFWHGTVPFEGTTKRLTIAADFLKK